jgi:hypothetical protein
MVNTIKINAIEDLVSIIPSIVFPTDLSWVSNNTFYGTVDTNSVGFGAILCRSSDGHYDEANAGAAATMRDLVIALESGTGTKLLMSKGYFRKDSFSFTANANLWVSTTNGLFTETVPSGSSEFVKRVGFVLDTVDHIYFDSTLSPLIGLVA